jgi:hypothetical protein
MGVDGDGEASGPFLCAHVAVEVDKPLRRGVMLKPDKTAKPEWFQIQFEKLPFLLLMWKNATHGVGVPYAGPKKRSREVIL